VGLEAGEEEQILVEAAVLEAEVVAAAEVEDVEEEGFEICQTALREACLGIFITFTFNSSHLFVLRSPFFGENEFEWGNFMNCYTLCCLKSRIAWFNKRSFQVQIIAFKRNASQLACEGNVPKF